MTIVAIRDVVAAHLRTYFADNSSIKIITDYFPVLETQPEDIVLSLQPISMSVSYADRSRLAIEPKLGITVTKRVSDDRQTTCDTVIAIVSDIVAALDTYRDGHNVIKTLEIADPLISVESLTDGNQAISQIVITMYGQQQRGLKL